MENIITTTTRVKRMTRLTSFALPAVMACTLSMPAFAQSVDQASPSRRNPENKASADSTAVTVGEAAMFGNG